MDLGELTPESGSPVLNGAGGSGEHGHARNGADASPVRTPSRPPVTSTKPRWLDRNWVWLLPIICMVVSEYKLRKRTAASSLSGSADLQTMFELATYGLVATWLILRKWVAAPRFRKPPALVGIMFVYTGLLVSSSTYAIYGGLAMGRSAQFVILAGLAFAIYKHARLRDLHRLVHAYAVLCAGSVFVGLAHKFPPASQNKIEARRFNWLYVHPVVTGTYLGLAVVILFVYLREPKMRPVAEWNWPTSVYGILFAVNVAGLLMTKTRGAIGGAVAGMFLVLFLNTTARRKQAVIVSGAFLAVLVVVGFAKPIISYLQRGESAQRLATLNSRTKLWGQAWDLFQKRPLTGYGLGASRGIFLDTTNLGGGHNALINVMTDLGLPGLLAWIALLVGVVVCILKFKPGTLGHRDRLIMLAMITFMVVNGITYEGLGSTANSQAIWLLMMVGWIGTLRRVEPTNVDPPLRVDAVGAPRRVAAYPRHGHSR